MNFTKFLSSGLILTALVFGFGLFSSVQVLAVSQVTITNLASNMPVNNASEGQISVCFTNTASLQETSLVLIEPSQSGSISLPAGDYDYVITSFVRSSLDGSVNDPCNPPASFPASILDVGTLNLLDNTAYSYNFVGTGAIQEPRTIPDFLSQTPTIFVENNPVVGVDPGLYVTYPDNFVNENATGVYGPLTSNLRVCLDSGLGGAWFLGVFSDINTIYLNTITTLPVGTVIYPPSIDGTCEDVTDPGAVMPTATLSSTSLTGTNAIFVNFTEGTSVTGFNLNLTNSNTTLTSSTPVQSTQTGLPLIRTGGSDL